MLYVTRTYKNSAFETLRIDRITLTATTPSNAYAVLTSRTYKRNVETEKVLIASNRTVANIVVEGNFDTIESVTGDYEYCDWTSPVAKCGMSDLPGVGDTV